MSNNKETLNLLKKISDKLDSLSSRQIYEINEALSLILEDLDEDSIDKQLSFISEPKDNIIQIWSDGACSGNPGPGGWGTIVRTSSDEIELSGYSAKTTNNIMEMTGALKGLEKTPAGSKVVLTTDSQYLLNGITKWIHGWKKKGWKKADGKPVLNQELWMQIDQLCSQRTVEWKWVKGHSQHPENERCDELATGAIKRKV